MIRSPAVFAAKPASSSSYHAAAVHYAANTWIKLTAGSLADSHTLTFSGWFKFSDLSNFPNCFLVYNNTNGGGVSFEVGFTFNTDLTVDTGGSGSSFHFGSDDGAVSASVWNHCLFSVDTNRPAGQKIGFVLLNGTSVLDPANTTDSDAAFLNDLNGSDIIIAGNDNSASNIDQDVADIQFWNNVAVDFSNPANVAKFISAGKPVDPAVAAAAFGAPTISFIGNAAAWTSQAAAQGFTISGTALTNASTSPSD
jgi:hypothetical protein